MRKKKKSLTENELVVGTGEELVREFGTNTYPLLYFKWMDNRHLLCSTGNLLNVMWQP